MTSQKIKLSWTVLFAIWAAQGIFFLLRFVTLPSDTEGGVLFGLSAFRLAGIVFLFAWIAFAVYLSMQANRNITWREKHLDSLFTSRAGDLYLIISLLAVLGGQALLAILWGLSQDRSVFTYVAYATRLAPLLNLVSLAGIEFIAWIAFNRRYARESIKAANNSLLHKVWLVWIVLGVLAAFVALTGLGIVPDKTGEWGLPGVPLLEWQIMVACLACVAVLLWESKSGSNTKHADLWISLALWAGILLLWLSQPVNPNFSALPPRAPNFEIYPFSDAQVYDEFAQSLLIGNGLKGKEIPPRPLYITFLAFLHLVAGQEYTRVIAAQLVFLALLPVGLYWVGREMYGRPIGVAIALLVGFREQTSNVAASFANGLSYSKLYLSEVPVTIPLAFFTFLAIRWVRAKYSNYLAFIAGGVLGIGILIRTQAVVALPMTILIALLMDRKSFYPILRSALLMTLAVVLAASPWLIRNYQNTGHLIFDSPFTQTINLAQRYSRMNGIEADALRRSDETDIEYNDRLISIFKDAVSQNPKEAVRVVFNRIFNNCVDNVLLLPLRNDLNSPQELLQPTRAFWEEWNGKPTTSQTILLAFYLFLLGLGFSAAWKRLGLLGLLPLGINLLYNVWTSLALLAGQRFLVAMDWSIYMYYMIGLLVLIGNFMLLMESARASFLTWAGSLDLDLSQPLNVSTRPWSHFLLAGALFLFVGASVPLSEAVFPQRYPPATQDQIINEFITSPAFSASNLNAACIQQTISTNGLIALRGRALSPRYYESGEGEFTDKLGYRPGEQPRLLFYLTGDYYGLIILNVNETPGFFPHASDVIVFRDGTDGNNAWFVLVKHDAREELYFSDTYKPRIPCFGAN